jgi:hypothetical protein
MRPFFDAIFRQHFQEKNGPQCASQRQQNSKTVKSKVHYRLATKTTFPVFRHHIDTVHIQSSYHTPCTPSHTNGNSIEAIDSIENKAKSSTSYWGEGRDQKD